MFKVDEWGLADEVNVIQFVLWINEWRLNVGGIDKLGNNPIWWGLEKNAI